MKKIFASLMLIAVCLSMFSCQRNKKDNTSTYDLGDYKIYSYPEIQFALPPNFKETNFGYGEIEYSNGKGAYFFFSAFDETDLQDQEMPADVTVQEYAQSLITEWFVDSVYVYNKENNSAVFDYYMEYFDEESEYYKHMVIKGSENLFLITFTCRAADAQTLAATAEQIFASILVG